jgi:SAM-dependent methyltransferase
MAPSSAPPRSRERAREAIAVEIAGRLHAAYAKQKHRLADLPEFSASHTDPEQRAENYLGAIASSPVTAAKTARCLSYHLALARFDPTDKIIVDVGSAFGTHARFFAGWGARKVYGIDSVPVHRIVNQTILMPATPELSFEHIEATSSATGLPDGVADCVMVWEGVSHFRDLSNFWKEAGRILKPGGVLIVTDGNNGCNPRVRRELVREWQDCESRYVVARRNFIMARHPSMAPADAERLAAESSGMDFVELADACEVFVSTGRTPERPYVTGSVPLNPKDAMFMERALDPYECARELEHAGFEARVWACYTSSRRGLWQLANRTLRGLTPLTIRWARSFNVVAHKVRPAAHGGTA